MLTGPDKLFETPDTITKIIKDNVEGAINLIEKAFHKKNYKINKNYLFMNIKDKRKMANGNYTEEIKKAVKEQYMKAGWKYVSIDIDFDYALFGKTFLLKATFAKSQEDLHNCINNATKDLKDNICSGPN